MRLPGDVGGADLARALGRVGYRVTRQIRLTTTDGGEHHVTIPAHASLRVGTLAAIVGDVAEHLHISRDELASRLFGRGA